ncbi:MAG: preprotein translocase subunit SecA, partial [Gemmatimonadota bacterium]
MLKAVATTLFGTKFERDVKRLRPLVDAILEHEKRLASVTENELRAQTDTFREIIRTRTEALESEITEIRDTRRHTEEAAEREALTARLRDAEDALRRETQAVLDEILPEAYASVREACRRLVGREIVVRGQTTVWDMVPYDVQLIGGIVLHQGKIAEMATGEGKTLVATLPLYLNALPGKGAHLVTVNDYLARRDAEWMGVVFEYLGLTVACLDATEPGSPERRAAYRGDITYGTNNEFGFDYLRDNMVLRLEDRVQRSHVYAIIDEVDSILIDEARTPLIISGPVGDEDNRKYGQYNAMVAELARRQTRRVNELVAEAEKLMTEAEAAGEELPYEAGEKLLAAQRGMPKHTRLMKLLQEPGVKKQLQRVEADYMRDKQLHQMDEWLLYTMDEKGHTVQVSDQGLDILSPNDHDAFVVPDLSEAVHAVEHDEALSVDEKRTRIAALEREYAEKNEKIHIVHNLLKAYTLFDKDVAYVVENGQILIVDEFTGRKMPGRRWSDGLHQAVEAKEGVRIQNENQTLATITFQNYFRLYQKLAGMTGTADTEAFEFQQIYGLEVVVVPTHKPMIRRDMPDLVYLHQNDKFDAIIEDIRDCVQRGQPALVGTTSIETSEKLSDRLKQAGIPHQVLNAKQHEREAMVIAQAGRPGTVTIATNMAGRGTDIVLGGNVARLVDQLRKDGVMSEEQLAGRARELENEWNDLHARVIGAGGLHIIGTERHESRRIDNQLRGRSGRQGDPGSSRFYLSLEDNLMRIFGDPERTKSLLKTVGMKEGEAIESGMLTRQIERAQRKVESHNFDARKNLLEYDDVANDQRKVIYRQRTEMMSTDDIGGVIKDVRAEVVRNMVAGLIPPDSVEEQWDVAGLEEAFERDFSVRTGLAEWLAEDPSRHGEEAAERLLAAVEGAYEEKSRQVPGSVMRHLERAVMLQQLDMHWREHLAGMDYLRQGIYLRAYAQKNPKQEYKREAFQLFTAMLDRIRSDTVIMLQRLQVRSEEEIEREEAERQRRLQARMQLQHAAPPDLGAAVPTAVAAMPERPPPQPIAAAVLEPFVRGERKV